MGSKILENLKRIDSLEDFEFVDYEGDLDVDMSRSPLNEAAEKLSSGVSSVMTALSLIAEENGFTIMVPVQAMAATAIGSLTGSLIGGPPGLVIGLITGAVIAYKTSPKKSKSETPKPVKSAVMEIFNKMTFQQKKELIKELLQCLKQSNIRNLILEMAKNETIRNMAMDIISSYLKAKIGFSLIRASK